MKKIQSFNEWFTGLEEGRQKVLREDKWMLAENAYNVLRSEVEELREFKRKHNEQLEKCYGKMEDVQIANNT